jgi:hypothetical protein
MNAIRDCKSRDMVKGTTLAAGFSPATGSTIFAAAASPTAGLLPAAGFSPEAASSPAAVTERPGTHELWLNPGYMHSLQCKCQQATCLEHTADVSQEHVVQSIADC